MQTTPGRGLTPPGRGSSPVHGSCRLREICPQIGMFRSFVDEVRGERGLQGGRRHAGGGEERVQRWEAAQIEAGRLARTCFRKRLREVTGLEIKTAHGKSGRREGADLLKEEGRA